MTRSAAVGTAVPRGSAPRATGARTTAARTASARTATTGARTARATPARPTASRTAPAARTGTPDRAALRPELRLVTTGVRAGRRARNGLRSRRGPFVLLVVALLALTTVGLLVLNTAIAVDSLKASQLRAENVTRAETVQRLEQQVVSARTPAEVARAAVAAGLVPAGVAGYLVLGPGGTTTLRGTPEPAPAPEPPPAPAPAPAGGN